ncbi:TPA: hypothetical protein ACOENG_001117 [Stenotrophomonas maltophilia]|uniref:hypothetical protein n=3 Tax=Lysobacteraceae TaxID=32033 RepID=UPI001D0C2BC2|nr:hypothetical protein [Stenotrophomonas maltophilia]MDH1130254.1 hypothetical protein [Stenotrophomonas maltophilia]MDH2037721.1 hypothetical protein [Stenotrophomonas maltophilia]MDU1661104.1 hypothetical protein [Stenotrophomonas maltophilia]MDZ5775077.1 hypothetical protein [Stenotrophomonas maltophilia]MDZ5805707.1 hypothetical protein [Stenotrophomonas maltophilia]
MMEMATCMRMAVAAGLALLSGGCATEWARFSDHADPLDESRWRCRAEANEKWPEKMDVVERTEEIEVLTVCKEGETCDVDGKYMTMLMPKTERHTVDVNAKENHSTSWAAWAAQAGYRRPSGLAADDHRRAPWSLGMTIIHAWRGSTGRAGRVSKVGRGEVAGA